MNPVQLIATLRKLGNYLAGLFPSLAKLADLIFGKLFALLQESPGYDRFKELLEKKEIAALSAIFQRFYWRPYSDDRLSHSASEDFAPEAFKIVRPLLQLAILSVLLIPFTGENFPFQRVSLETFASFKSTAPVWSIYLWQLLFALSWSALLAGLALSNRLGFLAGALASLYFLATTSITIPRDFWNALLGASVLVNLHLSESALARHTRTANLGSRVNLLLVSVAVGVQIMVMTPLKPLICESLKLQNAYAGIPSGVICGAILGLLLLTLVNLTLKYTHKNTHENTHENPQENSDATALDKATLKSYRLSAALMLFFLFANLSRSNAGVTAGLDLSSLSLSNAYLWPVWYFIGIGIMHKLISSSKVIARSLPDLVPAKYLSPLLLTLLPAALVCTTADTITLFFTNLPINAATTFLSTQSFAFYKVLSPFLFSDTQTRISTTWFSYVLMFDLYLVICFALTKCLSTELINRLFYLTALAYFLICEYLFQFHSFARTVKHSLILSLFFAVWLIWLMHTVGWNMSRQSSKLWPERGRILIYAAIVGLCVLEIHARLASLDFRINNEIFLAMFKGVIEVGPPYYLYILANKRLTTLPIKPSSLFKFFALGGLLSGLSNLFDKLSFCLNSNQAFTTFLANQVYRFSNYGTPSIYCPSSLSALVLKMVLYLTLLFALKKQIGKKDKSDSYTAFALMSLAGGIAAFSHSMVDLPLPTNFRLLFAPTAVYTSFNINLLNTFALAWLPAIFVSLFKAKAKPKYILALVSFAILLAGTINFELNSAFLRAADYIYQYAFLLIVSMALALQKLINTVELSQTDIDTVDDDKTRQKTTKVLETSLYVLLAAGIIWSGISNHPKLTQGVLDWQAVNDLIYIRQDMGSSYILFTGKIPKAVGGNVQDERGRAMAVAKQILSQAATSGKYENLNVLSIEEPAHMNASLVLRYSFQAKEKVLIYALRNKQENSTGEESQISQVSRPSQENSPNKESTNLDSTNLDRTNQESRREADKLYWAGTTAIVDDGADYIYYTIFGPPTKADHNEAELTIMVNKRSTPQQKNI
ncbi:MAG: hypothetical protein J0M35_15675 [Candidatus Obscuribacter phosphatis]|uniref:Uncharacterized protein n=1 Tax=Candidatus Obscuribacter phosphatis TaxID=1906157 RepID=A0A8J7TN84_9BACT|nr:hypothetical protein [Candidatus Obscuribacter phosphatis]